MDQILTRPFNPFGPLGGVNFPNAPGFTLDSNGYLVSNADGSLWAYSVDSDGVYGLDATTGYFLIQKVSPNGSN